MPTLNRASTRIDAADRIAWAETGQFTSLQLSKVTRPDGSEINVATLVSLAGEVERRIAANEWPNRADSDRWVAPRLHYALRIPRATAGDKAMWEWLSSTHFQNFVNWRWQDSTGQVADFHWYGAVNKQALMRLWWGAELLRNGSDYSPAVKAFAFQDFPNSFLHRPLVRCRSFALGILEALFDGDVERSSRDVNALARVLNLSTAGTPPEAKTEFASDDFTAFATWASVDAATPASWDPLPTGPSAADTTAISMQGGRGLADHGLVLAGLTLQP